MSFNSSAGDATYAIFDPFEIFEGPIFEVHVSNIHAGDKLHRHSKLLSAVKAVICGLNPLGYIVALQAARHMLGRLPASLRPPIRVGREAEFEEWFQHERLAERIGNPGS